MTAASVISPLTPRSQNASSSRTLSARIFAKPWIAISNRNHRLALARACSTASAEPVPLNELERPQRKGPKHHDEHRSTRMARRWRPPLAAAVIDGRLYLGNRLR